MKSPVIILGAGASFDYIDPTLRDNQRMPPLTDQLVSQAYFNREIAKGYSPEVENLFSVIAPKVNNGADKTLEQFLVQVGNYEEVIGMQFYLKDFFLGVSREFKRTNNYKALLSYIQRSETREATIVTFNYDTLLEQSMGDNSFTNLSEYSSGLVKVIKMHGSCDWSYIHSKNSREGNTAFSVRKKLGNLYKPRDIYTDTYIQDSDKDSQFHRFPAISIPSGETKTFVCPSAHIDVLGATLAQTDKILVIGWKAGDPYLLELIKKHAAHPISLFIVSGSNKGEIDEIFGKFKPYGDFSLMGQQNGFSSFIHSNSCATFFGTPY